MADNNTYFGDIFTIGPDEDETTFPAPPRSIVPSYCEMLILTLRTKEAIPKLEVSWRYVSWRTRAICVRLNVTKGQ